jgi:SET domain-containing protein
MQTNYRKRNKLPHFKVFARIGRSKIHGVGVIAIRNIKRGTHIFYGDDEPIYWVDKKKIKGLPNEIKKLYEDFCIIKGGRYGCPSNFNLLTPAWYLNHSKKPNVACDKEYEFYTLRDIKRGEELTVDYATYSAQNT